VCIVVKVGIDSNNSLNSIFGSIKTMSRSPNSQKEHNLPSKLI